MKKFLISMAVVFGALTVVFYISSIRELDSNSAKILGTNSVVNIQATVFCAACAILFVINIVGSIILTSHEKLEEEILNLKKEEPLKASMPLNTQNYIVSQTAQSEERRPTEQTRNVQKSENPDWIDDGDNFVRCPQCNNRMSIDFIKARKKCPHCGTPYIKVNQGE